MPLFRKAAESLGMATEYAKMEVMRTIVMYKLYYLLDIFARKKT